MLNILKRKKNNDNNAEAAKEPAKTGIFARLRAGLAKTRAGLAEGVALIVSGKKQLDGKLLIGHALEQLVRRRDALGKQALAAG